MLPSSDPHAMYRLSDVVVARSCMLRLLFPLNLLINPNVSIVKSRMRLSFVVTNMHCVSFFLRNVIPVTLRPFLSFP